MRIAIVYFDHFFIEQGTPPGGRRVRDIGRGLVASGHNVSIYLLKRSKTEQDIEIDGINFSFLGDSGKGKLSGRIAYWSQLISLANKEKIDWLLLYNVHIDAILPVLKLRRQGVKICTEACDLLSSFFHYDSLAGISKSLLHKSSELLIPRVTDLNIGISRFLIEHFKTIAPNTPRLLLPVLVDSDLFRFSESASLEVSKKWGIHPDKIVIAYVGGLWKQHGVKNLIEAFANISKKYPLAQLIIAGRLVKAMTHDDVEELINKYELENKVILPGWVSTEDVIGIYSRADVLVLPQIEDESMLAALPTKLAEYSQMGKAIVSTNVGDIGLYFRDGESALLVKSGQSEAMVEALITLIEDSELREHIGAAAKQVASDHFNYGRAGKYLSDKMIKISNKHRLSE